MKALEGLKQESAAHFHVARPSRVTANTGFFIFIFKKIKILKIYDRSKKFQKWAPVAHGEGDRPFL